MVGRFKGRSNYGVTMRLGTERFQGEISDLLLREEYELDPGLVGCLVQFMGSIREFRIYQKNVKGPKWLPFVSEMPKLICFILPLDLPPLLMFSAASASFG
ncbi:ubiquinol-cytochrome C reductase iron-sulfur subunit, partial [Striga asiatica]